MNANRIAAATGIFLSLAVAAPAVAFARHGADDRVGHLRGGHGADDGARHARQGADDGVGHARHGGDDGAGHR
jgi:hypothetical protein